MRSAPNNKRDSEEVVDRTIATQSIMSDNARIADVDGNMTPT